jgi:gamma-glutamyl:cysteine ligase YbdK (ATP-grasp superfamily)
VNDAKRLARLTAGLSTAFDATLEAITRPQPDYGQITVRVGDRQIRLTRAQAINLYWTLEALYGDNDEQDNA